MFIKKRGCRKKKATIEFSWIFALIVGAVILFFAFYFIGTKFTEKNFLQKVQTEQSLDILLNPFSYMGGLGATSSKEISLKNTEKINFSCELDGNLGYNGIFVNARLSSSSKLKAIYDKYIFSEKFIEGKNFQIIGKPFNMPWRIADLIFFISKDKNYCFVGIPEAEEEFGSSMTGLNISNFQFVDLGQESKCKGVKICENNNCDIVLDKNSGIVSKNNKELYFSGDALMYAAIFSDPSIYECNLKRLAKRIQFQTEIYNAKVIELSKRCSGQFNLIDLKNAAGQLYSKEGQLESIFITLKSASDELINQNIAAECTLF